MTMKSQRSKEIRTRNTLEELLAITRTTQDASIQKGQPGETCSFTNLDLQPLDPFGTKVEAVSIHTESDSLCEQDWLDLVLFSVLNDLRVSLSRARHSKTLSSGLIWYLPALTQALKRSRASAFSFVIASAIMRSVGIQRKEENILRRASLMMTISRAVRRSSNVGADGDMR